MSGGAWKEKGFVVPEGVDLKGLKLGPGVIQKAESDRGRVMLGWIYLATAFMLGALVATGMLWLTIPYLPYAR